MSATITERLRQVLIKLAEDTSLDASERLDATRQLIDINKPKRVHATKGKKPVSSLLGSK